MIIGLTGGSGSGKSTVATLLKKYNMFIIDADVISHDIIKKGKSAYNEVVQTFGQSILDETGEIIRKELGNIVFNNKQKLNILTKCIHKYVIIETKRLLEDAINSKKYNGVVIDAPLLIEAGLHKIVSEVWVVYADIDIRIARIMQRDNISEIQAKSRIDAQMPWQKLSSYADIVINNNRNYDDMAKQIEEILYKRME